MHYVIRERFELVGGRQAPVLDAGGRPRRDKAGKPVTVLTGRVARRSWELLGDSKVVDTAPTPSPLRQKALEMLRGGKTKPAGSARSGPDVNAALSEKGAMEKGGA